MMTKLLFLSALFLTFLSPRVHAYSATSVDSGGKPDHQFEYDVQQLYTDCALESKLNFNAFRRAYLGYLRLLQEGSVRPDRPLTVIDFNLPSTQKRLYVIDLVQRKLLFHTYTSHGQGSGNEHATSFSNIPDSHMSSLGFYVTAETYQGKHGYSLRLNGMDKGYNDNARSRAVVMHGADYVSEAFIRRAGRLGRSYGCPALGWEVYKEVIDKIKGGSCLFISYEDPEYLTKSRYLKTEEVLKANRKAWVAN